MGCWRRDLGPRRSKSDGRNLCNVEINGFYSPYIWAINWVRMTWVMCVCGVYVGDREMHTEFVVQN